MKALIAGLFVLLLGGCNFLEARSTLERARAVEFPASREDIVSIADCTPHYHSQLIADRFIHNPGASWTEWYAINEKYDLVIRTDSTTDYQIMCPDDIWIEKRSDLLQR